VIVFFPIAQRCQIGEAFKGANQNSNGTVALLYPFQFHFFVIQSFTIISDIHRKKSVISSTTAINSALMLVFPLPVFSRFSIVLRYKEEITEFQNSDTNELFP
jgi:hypothetical protein